MFTCHPDDEKCCGKWQVTIQCTIFVSSLNLTWAFLECGRKLEESEEVQAGTCKKKPRSEPVAHRTFLFMIAWCLEIKVQLKPLVSHHFMVRWAFNCLIAACHTGRLKPRFEPLTSVLWGGCALTRRPAHKKYLQVTALFPKPLKLERWWVNFHVCDIDKERGKGKTLSTNFSSGV